ncbi:chemotaxis protein CheA [Nitrosomonas stercoris]|uniref:Chemotaxis protein CheA n=1 Tax=Nitrosomonas stercoris TaxID=1444684 RepID=A0A4Y1YT41_9PROT|nr:chemotaxis protein CheA [Nitrosomonas stercoris]
MSTDLEQFYQIFFEEAGELLEEMEIRLLELNIAAPDPEDLNAIFRVAHSIKGGAGTFGFTDMTELTHVLESLLDKLRKDELELRSEMIDTFLRARDILVNQLNEHRGEGSADAAEVAAIISELKALSAGEVADEEDASTSVSSMPQTASSPETVSVNEEVIPYRIEFNCADLSKPVMDKLLSDLAQQGQLEVISDPADEAVCILRLATAESEEDIWESLAFLVDPAHLSIGVDEQPKQPIVEQAKAEQIPVSSEQQEAVSPDDKVPTSALTQKTQIASKPPSSSQRKSAASHTGSSSSESSSIRVSVEKVDQMINLVGELVITQAMLAQTASQIDPVIFEKLLNGLNQLERNTRDLQEAVMSIRMMPISFVFSRFPRVVRDVASKLNKQVELKTIGEGTELDKGLIEKITDPLTHLVRNSLDHGIETPEKRKALGKPAHGTITLRASHQGGSVVIEVMDDGAGLNRKKILEKARSRGLPISEDISDRDIWMLIFEAGFSTAEVVTDVSGRGVGMDVVKRNIEGLGGRIEIDSMIGKGTKISIRLPLTLAILDGLSVSVGDQLFIIPLTYITESLKPAEADIRTIRGQGRVVQVRGEYLPVIALHEIFNLEPVVKNMHEGILVILDAEGSKAAMFVDALVGQHQVVIKSLESNYRRVAGVSGATIMGDGSVALILDAVGLVNVVKRKITHAA